MMTENELYLTVGNLQAQLRNLEKSVATLQKTVDSLNDLLAQTRGGWRALVAVGAIACAIGASFSQLFKNLLELFK